jgi:hypothetical protein
VARIVFPKVENDALGFLFTISKFYLNESLKEKIYNKLE